MAELFWTKKAPIADGWYWWRKDIAYVGFIVCVAGGFANGGSYRIEVATLGGEWYGPLVPPGGDAIENCAPPGEAGG